MEGFWSLESSEMIEELNNSPKISNKTSENWNINRTTTIFTHNLVVGTVIIGSANQYFCIALYTVLEHIKYCSSWSHLDYGQTKAKVKEHVVLHVQLRRFFKVWQSSWKDVLIRLANKQQNLSFRFEASALSGMRPVLTFSSYCFITLHWMLSMNFRDCTLLSLYPACFRKRKKSQTLGVQLWRCLTMP